MSTLRALSLLTFVLAGPALFGQGCCCGDQCTPPPPGPVASLAFDTLNESYADPLDDADQDASNGFQLIVGVILVDGDSSYGDVTVTSDALPGEEFNGTFSGGRANIVVTLTSAAAPGQLHNLTARAENGTDPAITVTASTTVVAQSLPSGASCAIESPADGSTVDLASSVTVRCSGQAGNSAAQSALVRTGTVRVTATGGGGATTTQEVQLASDPNDTTDPVDGIGSHALTFPAPGSYVLTATLVDNGALFASAVTAPAVEVTATSDVETVTIDFPADGSTITLAEIFDSDGTDGATFSVVGTSSALADGAYTVECTSTTLPGTSGAAGDFGVQAGGAFTFLVENVLYPNCVVTATVAGVTATSTFTIDFGDTLPVLVAIGATADADGDGFYEIPDDADPLTVDTIDVAVVLTAQLPAGPSWTVHAVLTDAEGNVVASSDIPVDAATLPLSVALPVGDESTYTLSVSAEDQDGNVTGVITQAFRVDTVAPQPSFFYPNNGVSVAASADLSADPGLQVRVSLGTAAGTISEGSTGTITVDGTDSTCTYTGGLCPVVLTLVDGVHTLSAVVIDPAGNSAAIGPITFSSDGSPPEVGSIIAVNAGVDGVLTVADNGGEAAGGVTSDVTVTFLDSSMDGLNVALDSDQGFGANALAVGNVATFPSFAFAQGSQTLTVFAQDAAGNPVASANTALIRVDTLLPSVAIAAPLGPTVSATDDVDAGTAGVQVDVLAAVSDSADGATVAVFNGATQLGEAAANGGAATVRVTLPDGSTSLTAQVSDPAGNSATSAAVVLEVDGSAPTLVLTNPGDQAPTDDADGAAPGLQVDVTVATTGLAAGRTVTISSDLEGDVGSAPADASGTTVVRVTLTRTALHALTGFAQDEVGNPATSNTVSFNVNSGVFFIAFSNPPDRAGFLSVGAAEDTDAGTAGAQVSVELSTDAPNGTPATLLVDGAAVDTNPTSGSAVTFALTLADGQSGTLEVRVSGSGADGTTGARNFRVDLGRPTVAITSPPGGVATYTVAQDASVVAGLQTTLGVAVTECENGVITIRNGVAVLGTAAVDASGAGTVNVDITETSSGAALTWTATCVDAEGNAPSAPDTLTATVDITAPAVPALTVTTLDARAGQVRVAFAEPGDDDATGTATTIEVKWRRGAAIDLAGFDDVGLVSAPAITPNGGGTARQSTTTGLAFDNTWHVAVRATDDVGNRSLAQGQVQLSTQELVLGPPAGVTGWAQALGRAAGDVNGDGFEDIVVGAPDQSSFGAGGFEVIYGAADPAQVTRTFVDPPASFPCAAGTCTPVELGWAVNVLPSQNGDAFDDVLVVGYDVNYNQEFLFLYAGSATGIAANAAPASVLEHDGAFSLAGFISANVGDVNGDGDADWAIAVPLASTALLFLNSGAFPASGLLEDRADTVFTHADPEVFAGSAVAGFGSNGDAFDDFVITAVESTVAPQLFVVRGRAVWPATIDLQALPAGDQLAAPVRPGIGFDATSGDVDGDGDLDLVLLTNGGVEVMQNDAGLPAGDVVRTASLIVDVGCGFGLGDLNKDGRAETIVGGASPVAVTFGADPIVSGAAEATYPVVAGFPNNVRFATAELLGGASSGGDLVIAASTAPGSLTIRY